MTNTQNKTTAPIDLNLRVSTASAQWLLESAADKNTPIHHHNELDLYICGEEAFAQIAADIKKAKGSVDIICWGFDPAMELVRTKTVWPRGETWGGLLKDVAAGKYNDGKPVQVRILAWYNALGNFGTNNLPGYKKNAAYEARQASSRGMAAAVTPGGASKLRPAPLPVDPKDQREVFNVHWYKDAFNGTLKNLAFRTRDGDSKAVSASLEQEPGVRDVAENVSLIEVATDHQKTILIDYEHDGGANAVGYVMGLNSVTDYWDTQQHLFSDSRRGAAWEGAAEDGYPYLKPYQDYACRIRGEALVAVSKNFTDAWNRAHGMGDKLSRTHDVHAPPPGLTKNLERKAQRAQIVRTQPEENDKSIKRLYQQATSFARQYVYIENQYFQFTEWAQQLKTYRQDHVKGWQAAKKSPKDLPNLHVIVVIPTPERAQMVPRTYDTVKALGHGSSMPNQDKKTEDELKKYAEWEAYAKSARANGEVPSPYAYPGDLSSAAQSAKEIGAKQDISKELNTLGMRTLVASLWTFDHEWQMTQKKELEQVKAWDGVAVYSRSQRYKKMGQELLKARYREIYIHSKLMMIDDSMFTLGSANLNLRSMAVDAEINVASDDMLCSTDLRKRVWGLHTGHVDGSNPTNLEPEALSEAFKTWSDVMTSNAEARVKGTAPTGFIFPFKDERTSRIRVA